MLDGATRTGCFMYNESVRIGSEILPGLLGVAPGWLRQSPEPG